MSAIQLRPYQSRVIEDVRASIRRGNKAILLVMSTGCHAKGTPILMADGSIKPVEDICVDDHVMGPDSRPRRITRLHRGTDEMFKITPVKGDSFVVNGDHILSLYVVKTPCDKWESRVDNVSVRDWISKAKHWKHLRKLYRVPVNFPAIPEPAMPPYLLGVFLGDGSITTGPQISNPDPEIRQEVQRLAAQIGCEVHDMANVKCPLFSVVTPRGQPNPALNMLKDMKLFGHNAYGKFIPDEYKRGSIETRKELLAGIMDTDGSLSHSGYDFISASETLARDVVFIARSLGLAAYLKKCKKTWQNGVGDYWRVSISGDTSIIPCRIARKQAAPRRQKKNVLVTGFSVESVGCDNYYGFECEGDHLYVMGDFTVTHNSGKTAVATVIAEFAHAKGNPVLFLAPRRELVYQTVKHFGFQGMDTGIIMAGESPEISSGNQIACIPSLHRRCFTNSHRFSLSSVKPKASIVIVDEAHIGIGGIAQQVIDYYKEQGSIIIGLSATPCRSDGKGLGMIYDDLVEGPSMKELIDMGFLVPCRYFTASKLDLEKVRVSNGDYLQKDLDEAVRNQPKLVGDVVENWLNICPDRKTVVFAVNRAHAMSIHDEFNRVGVKCEYLDGKTPNEERKEILHRIEHGDSMVISSVDVLSYGWDSPAVKCGIFARPTKSLSRFLQMGGRILRPCPSTGFSDSILIDHAGVVGPDGLGWLDDTQPWSLNGKETIQERKEKEKGEKPEPKPYECPKCKALIKPAPTCPHCGAELGKQFAKAIEAHEAMLEELDRDTLERKAKQMTTEEKRNFYAQLAHYAKERGYKEGWISHAFRARTLVWPNKYKGTPPTPPTRETLAWIKHRNYKAAKKREQVQQQELMAV